MLFNHPKTIPHLQGPWKNCLPPNQSLVPKKDGDQEWHFLVSLPVVWLCKTLILGNLRESSTGLTLYFEIITNTKSWNSRGHVDPSPCFPQWQHLKHCSVWPKTGTDTHTRQRSCRSLGAFLSVFLYEIPDRLPPLEIHSQFLDFSITMHTPLLLHLQSRPASSPLSPTLGNTDLYYRYCHFENTIYIKSQAADLLRTALSFSTMPSSTGQAAVGTHSCFTAGWHPLVWTCQGVEHSPLKRHLGWFQVLTIKNKVIKFEYEFLSENEFSRRNAPECSVGSILWETACFQSGHTFNISTSQQ